MPIAIVPIVTEWRQEFFSAAVAAGADDVLLVRGDTAVHAAETLSRIKQAVRIFGPPKSGACASSTSARTPSSAACSTRSRS